MMRMNKEDIEIITARLFQGLVEKSFRDKYGEGWFQKELMARIVEKANRDEDETAKKYREFISNRGTKASLSDMDVTLCSTVLIYDEKYSGEMYSEPSQKSMLHDLRVDRNRLFGHAGTLSESMRVTLFSRIIADLQLALDVFDVPSFDEGLAEDIRKLQESFFGIKLNEASSGPLAAQYDVGEKLFLEGNVQDAFNIHNELAEMGYAPSMARLAEMYIKGTGTSQSFENAEKWLSNALKLGFEGAAELLGKILKYRKLVEEAEGGSSVSMVKLGSWYESGELVGRDGDKALKYYSKALSKGSLFARSRILAMAEEGNLQALECIYHELMDTMSLGDKKKIFKKVFDNSEEPHEWERIIELASDDSELMYSLCSEFYDNRSSEKSASLCLTLAQKGAELKYGSCTNILGILYEIGVGMEKDEKRAADLYEEAAELGSAAGSGNAANMYLNGIGRPLDRRKAFEYAKSAADMGSPRGQFFLGEFYREGLYGRDYYDTIVEADLKLAFEYYLASANQGYYLSYMPLADCYRYGNGTESNREAALEWYAKANCEEGYRKMAEMWETYKYNDPSKAFEYYKKASEFRSDPEYDYKLGKCYFEGKVTQRNGALAAKHLMNCYNNHNDYKVRDECAYMLGVLYKRGDGVEQNDMESFNYFVRAASGSATHEYNYKALYEVSKFVRRDPETFNCMKYDFKRKRDYFASCCRVHTDGESMLWFCRDNGVIEAMWECYVAGQRRDYESLGEMAEKNYLPAMEELLRVYDDGEINLSDKELSELYLKVKSQGGRIYLSRDTVDRLEILLK